MIEKLDYQLKIDMKNKQSMKIKDLEKRQQDLALRRVRSYINLGKITSFEIDRNSQLPVHCFSQCNE